MRIYIISLVVFLLAFSNGISSAEDFYLDSPRNKGALRFELDNDAIFDEDSGFSNGWSIQYHTVRYASWEESKTFGFINNTVVNVEIAKVIVIGCMRLLMNLQYVLLITLVIPTPT